MALPPNFKLNSGNSIPAIALGTLEADDALAAEAVFTAIKDGYRHIDTAKIYGNEKGVGAGIRKAIAELGVKREEIYVTTKLWLTDFHNAAEALDESLEKLFPGDANAYVDLYLIHWPYPLLENGELDTSITYNQTYAQLEEIPRTKVKDIGVSNFTIEQVKSLLGTAKRTPVVNQIELHVNLPQVELVDFLLSGKYGNPAHDGKIIIPEGYAPLAKGNFEDPTISKIAKAHKTHPANVVLSWSVARHTVPLPKSANPERIKSNIEYIELSSEEKREIDEIAANGPQKRYYKYAGLILLIKVIL